MQNKDKWRLQSKLEGKILYPCPYCDNGIECRITCKYLAKYHGNRNSREALDDLKYVHGFTHQEALEELYGE